MLTEVTIMFPPAELLVVPSRVTTDDTHKSDFAIDDEPDGDDELEPAIQTKRCPPDRYGRGKAKEIWEGGGDGDMAGGRRRMVPCFTVDDRWMLFGLLQTT